MDLLRQDLRQALRNLARSRAAGSASGQAGSHDRTVRALGGPAEASRGRQSMGGVLQIAPRPPNQPIVKGGLWQVHITR
jgi:hypothetical protein